MTQTAHTPGPWRSTWRNLDNVKDWRSRIPYAIEYLPENYNAVLPIADVCDQPNAEENARLIAAAPDLLAACKKAFDELVENLDEIGIDHESDDTAIMLRAAIAKATGSAP